jgi:hypothetical protein
LNPLAGPEREHYCSKTNIISPDGVTFDRLISTSTNKDMPKKKTLTPIDKAKILLSKDYIIIPRRMKKGLILKIAPPPSQYFHMHVSTPMSYNT